jgi:negative regulator of flagellin synthesis FlgM
MTNKHAPMQHPASGRVAAEAAGTTAPGGRLASEMAGLVRDMAAAPPVDAEKVARLKLAIASGSYRIDADAIADAIMESVSPAAKPADSPGKPRG